MLHLVEEVKVARDQTTGGTIFNRWFRQTNIESCVN